MLDDRDYMRRTPRFEPRWLVTVILVAINVVIFVAQNVADSADNLHIYNKFALSVDGLKHGRVWQLLTFQFLHLPLNAGGIFHLLGNLFAIQLFGPAVEKTIGRLSFIKLYLLSGSLGGLVQMAGGLVSTAHFGGAVVGASAGAFGLLAALATLYPDRRLHPFFLPFAIRADVLLMLSVAGTLICLFLPSGQVAHCAHLGGIFAGFMFARRWARNRGAGVFVGTVNLLESAPAPE
jgi:membrane associated rhomboid family serine protease